MGLAVKGRTVLFLTTRICGSESWNARVEGKEMAKSLTLPKEAARKEGSQKLAQKPVPRRMGKANINQGRVTGPVLISSRRELVRRGMLVICHTPLWRLQVPVRRL